MSLILRSLLRDARPLSRAIRRFEDDWMLEDWPARKVRRTLNPVYEHPLSIMNDMGRQMASTLNRMQEMVDEMDTLEEVANRMEDRRGRSEAIVRRTESGGLQLALDVADYKPEDLKIKLMDDHLVIEAESESAGKDSYKRSHFKRWFKLPEDCKVDEIKSKLTNDDRLVIDLPLNKPIESNARSIPIEVEKKNAVENNDASQNPTAHSVNHENEHKDRDQNRRATHRN